MPTTHVNCFVFAFINLQLLCSPNHACRLQLFKLPLLCCADYACRLLLSSIDQAAATLLSQPLFLTAAVQATAAVSSLTNVFKIQIKESFAFYNQGTQQFSHIKNVYSQMLNKSSWSGPQPSTKSAAASPATSETNESSEWNVSKLS